MSTHPRLVQTVLDATEPRRLAEFYRELLGLAYRSGDEPPDAGPDEADWLVLVDPGGGHALAVQQVDELPRTTWPDPGVPMQLHLDMTVDDVTALAQVRSRALALGATELLDRSDDGEEPLYVFADPVGHPFCVFVG